MLDICLAVPSTLNVFSVQGLLLLAEWVPYTHGPASDMSLATQNLTSVEDNMAWSIIGQAIRLAYLLRLDRYSFRSESTPRKQDPLESRKALTWICKSAHSQQIRSSKTNMCFQSHLYRRQTNFSPHGSVVLVPRAVTIDAVFNQRLSVAASQRGHPTQVPICAPRVSRAHAAAAQLA